MILLALALLAATPRHEVARITCHDGDTCTLDWLIAVHTDEGIGVRITTTSEAVARTVRLCDINAPELNTPAGPPSRDALNFWLLHARIIEWQPALENGKDKRDSFGRWLGWLWIDGVEVNAKLVTEGFAAPYTEKCPR